ncbi:hypothetical protein BSL78_29055, partial [Apostichopus japonicus]
KTAVIDLLDVFLQLTGAPLPPPAYQPPDEASSPMQTFTGVGTMNVQQVRDAICAYADKQCCYGTGAAERMVFEKMDPSGGLHALKSLSTVSTGEFHRDRSTSWEHLPYRGGPIDGPIAGLLQLSGISPAPLSNFLTTMTIDRDPSYSNSRFAITVLDVALYYVLVVTVEEGLLVFLVMEEAIAPINRKERPKQEPALSVRRNGNI